MREAKKDVLIMGKVLIWGKMLILGSVKFRDLCQLVKRLNVDKNTGYLFFGNPPLPQISTFSLGQEVCSYNEKSAYYECAYN